MSLEQDIEKLKADYAEKEANLRREDTILQKFGSLIDGYKKPMVHFYKLYGRRGTVHFYLNRYDSLREQGKSPDRALLKALLEQFPGVPITKYRDACVGFRPAIAAEADAMKARERGKTVDLYDCGPVTVQLEPSSYSQTAKFEWTTYLDGEMWEIRVEYPFYKVIRQIGQYICEYEYYRDHEVRRVRRCDLNPHSPMQCIKYASGDHKTPNTFVVYWDTDSAIQTDYTELIEEK
jgi:hypothetical protein